MSGQKLLPSALQTTINLYYNTFSSEPDHGQPLDKNRLCWSAVFFSLEKKKIIKALQYFCSGCHPSLLSQPSQKSRVRQRRSKRLKDSDPKWYKEITLHLTYTICLDQAFSAFKSATAPNWPGSDAFQLCVSQIRLYICGNCAQHFTRKARLIMGYDGPLSNRIRPWREENSHFTRRVEFMTKPDLISRRVWSVKKTCPIQMKWKCSSINSVAEKMCAAVPHTPIHSDSTSSFVRKHLIQPSHLLIKVQ